MARMEMDLGKREKTARYEPSGVGLLCPSCAHVVDKGESSIVPRKDGR